MLMLIVSPVVSVIIMVLLSRLFLTPGETPSLFESILFTFMIIFPFCFVSGFVFIRFLGAAVHTPAFTAGSAFSRETIGGIAAGITITILTSGLFNTYEILLLIQVLAGTWALLSFNKVTAVQELLIKISALVIAILVLFFNTDVFFRQLVLPGINVTGTSDTSFGNITTGSYEGEESLYYNHRLVLYTDDVAEREENVHFAMLQNPSPSHVILVSGSPKSLIPELLKYPVKKITYLETDPVLAARTEPAATPPGVKYTSLRTDAYRYLTDSQEPADVILLLTPPPSTLLLGRYYSIEFFSSVKKQLGSHGIFICTPGSSETYYNNESILLFSSVYSTLKALFRNVLPVAGNKLYFLASDASLSPEFCRLTNERKISNYYVSPDFMSDDLTSRKSLELVSLLESKNNITSATAPSVVYSYQLYNISRDKKSGLAAIVLMIAVLVMPVSGLRKSDLLMYFSAFALAVFEITLILAIQITAGNMYHITGLVLAGIMSGLAIGSGVSIPYLESRAVTSSGMMLAVYYFFAAMATQLLPALQGGVFSIAVLILISIPPSVLTGNMFRQFTIVRSDARAPSLVYSADLAGSAAGFILAAGIIIPLLGISGTLYIAAGIVFAVFLFGTIINK
jgi:spermidine synthase